jgi:transcriptional regulator with XRE-family HTH domain
MTQNEQSTGAKRPFKQTRALIRLALNEGLTQKEIAALCRTQQSIVSAWAKGTKLANEGQLTELLTRYGHTLRRQSFRLYWSIDDETKTKKFYRVEGKVIFQHIFYNLRRETKSGKLRKNNPEVRLIVHHQGQDSFRLVEQNRIPLDDGLLIDSYQDEAIWNSFIFEPQTGKELVQLIDVSCANMTKKWPSDGHSLPFLIRQALLQHGFQVEDIEEYPAQW